MFNKSKKILLTLALGSLFVSQNGFAASISIMEMVDGQKYDTTNNTTSVKVRLNEVAKDLDGTADISGDATKNINGKVDALSAKVDGSNDNLDTRIKNAGKNIDGTDASSTAGQTLKEKENTLAGLMSTGALDGSTTTLTTKVNDLGMLINGSAPDATNHLLSKIGSKVDTAGTLTSGSFADNDSVFSMVRYIYESIAGTTSGSTTTWAQLTNDVTADAAQNIAAYTGKKTVKEVLEALVARLGV